MMCRLLALYALLPSLAVAEVFANDTCCPGLVFQDRCNSCVCGASGRKAGAACTNRICPKSETEGRCQPFVAFSKGDGLNTCTCPADGDLTKAQCTSLKCPKVELAVHTEHVSNGTCCPGYSFKSTDGATGCNTCRCSASGLKNESACTLMACPPSMLPSERCLPMSNFRAADGFNMCTCPWSGIKAEANCTSYVCPGKEEPEEDGTCCPGLLFTAADGCNTCRCAASGQRHDSRCTRLNCPPVQLPRAWCVPHSIFPAGDGLNSCICPANGRKEEANCTSLTCPEAPTLPTPAPSTEQGLCCPNRSFIAADGCNTCMCSDKGWKNASACTRMACPPWMALTQNCTPFSAYPAGDGLNFCVCPADGQKSPEHCTQLECPQPPVRPGRPGRPGRPIGTCCPGVSYTAPDGCNTCICPASGLMSDPTACTLRACPPEDPAARGRCQPLAAFPKGDGTNTCTCPASGLRRDARCTDLACPVPPEDANKVLLP